MEIREIDPPAYMELGSNVLITNPNTIAHLTGAHAPVASVTPHSLCMIDLNRCDYDVLCVSIPYDV